MLYMYISISRLILYSLLSIVVSDLFAPCEEQGFYLLHANTYT